MLSLRDLVSCSELEAKAAEKCSFTAFQGEGVELFVPVTAPLRLFDPSFLDLVPKHCSIFKYLCCGDSPVCLVHNI